MIDSPAVTFLQALFATDDTVLYRPIETWVENGRKESRIVYKATVRRRAQPQIIAATIKQLMQVGETERANLFFGVCPRFGGDKQKTFDLDWQIRTVRCLWSDIDGTTVEDARKRIETAGLPAPSIIVSSGNGGHFYWLLDEPYPIDDVGAPLPVLKEWIEQPGKPKKAKPYITGADGEKLYLNSPQNMPKLSPKAQYVKDILGGLAFKVGGDHTIDLPRLLRIPGTLNRKDQRNGAEPKPCVLVECHQDRRYPFSGFEQFAAACPNRVRREKVAKVKLPAKKRATSKQKDEFAELLAACDASSDRSLADFSLCCWAIKFGMVKDEVWREAAHVGKFKERGEDYFDLTWDSAAAQVKEVIYTKVEKREQQKAERRNDGDAPRPDLQGGIIKALADAICKGEHFAQDAGDRVYRFVGGVYRSGGDRLLRVRVKRLLNLWNMTTEWSRNVSTEVVEYIRVDSPELWQEPPMDVVNVKNGLLQVADRALLPHSHEHLSPIQLPVKFDPKAKCPNIEKFVGEVFPGDAASLAYEIPGLLMVPDTSAQKAVLATGEGGNGKSTYLTMLIAFLGSQNVSALSLHKLESDKFAAARLIGKLANICPDLPSDHLASTGMFKALTGEDSQITTEFKFHNSFEFKPFVRLVFSANHPPRSNDSTHAFFRRWLVIPFERTFGDGNTPAIPRKELDARLSTPSELSGLLNRALDARAEFEIRKGFSEPTSVKRAWEEFHATTDPLSVWLDRNTVEEPKAFIEKAALRIEFNRHLEKAGRPPLTNKGFGSALAKLRPDVEEAQRTWRSKPKTWCYIGIGMRSPDSRDSRDTPYMFNARASEHMDGESPVDETYRDNTVNTVNPVNDFTEEEARGMLNGWIGND